MMSIEKSLYEAPMGLAALEAEPDIEIEIEDPEEVRIKMGGMELEIKEGEDDEDFNVNLAEIMSESDIQSLAGDLAEDIDNDIASRKDWEEMYRDGITLLGLKFEERTEPWDGACGVFHPMITEAVVRFQSDTIMETFPAKGPCRTQIIGKETPEKKEAAVRVQEDMNYQRKCLSTVQSMKRCCGTCQVQALRSRRSTTTHHYNAKYPYLFLQKT
jgi:hypothetical protein